MGLSHLAIANATKGLRVAAICDSSWPLVSALRKITRIPGYTSHKKMLDAHKLDGVIISVPNAHHYAVAIDCIDNGVNVFIEKPLTLKYEHSVDLVARAERRGVFGQVGYVNRYNQMFAHAKLLLSQGVLGTIETYESCMVGGVILEPNTKGWRNDYNRGGGCLFDYGPHCLDLVHYLIGRGASVSHASLESVYSSAVDDIVRADFQHENGLSGKIMVNWSDSTPRKAENSFEAKGTKGTIAVNKQEICLHLDEPDLNSRYGAGENSIFITDFDTSVGFYLRGEDFSRQMEHFSVLLANSETTNMCSLVDAAETDRLIGEIFNRSGYAF
jgi:predicted dehydrogenase